MLLSAIFFVLSVTLMVVFLEVKRYEQKRAVMLFAPTQRARLDAFAALSKEKLSHSGTELAKLPPVILFYAQIAIHEIALAIAASARFLESQAYALADLVSHKHRFEIRETRSEFLIRMTEHKQGRARPHGF
jgi:hypothetical protein